MAVLYYYSGQYHKARKLFKKVYQIRSETYKSNLNVLEMATCLSDVGLVYFALGNLKKAKKRSEDALKALKKSQKCNAVREFVV